MMPRDGGVIEGEGLVGLQADPHGFKGLLDLL